MSSYFCDKFKTTTVTRSKEPDHVSLDLMICVANSTWSSPLDLVTVIITISPTFNVIAADKMHRNMNEEIFEFECIIIQIQLNCVLSVDIFNTYCWVYKNEYQLNMSTDYVTKNWVFYEINRRLENGMARR